MRAAWSAVAASNPLHLHLFSLPSLHPFSAGSCTGTAPMDSLKASRYLPTSAPTALTMPTGIALPMCLRAVLSSS